MARDRASRPEAEPWRLFVAVEVPIQVRRSLADAVVPMRERLPGARWVPIANQHLTLTFLGATWPRLVPWVGEVVAEVAARHGRFEVTLDGLGTFPNDKRPRVLWAAVVDPTGRLGAIAHDLDEALASQFQPESRDFTPHLTLARLDGKTPFEPAGASVPAEAGFAVQELVVFRSHLGRPTPRYEPIARQQLGGDA